MTSTTLDTSLIQTTISNVYMGLVCTFGLSWFT